MIGFGPGDLEGVMTLHNGALVIRTTVANYDLARVLVDASSSVNILFCVALEQMGMKVRDLEHITTPIFWVLKSRDAPAQPN